MADETVTVDLDVMIIEAGILANSLTSSDAGKALQDKIVAAANEAWGQRKPDVTLQLNPFEAGMLLGGLSRSSGNVTGDLINRTFSAVNAKLQELGIQPLNNPAPSLNDAGPAAGLDPSQLGQGGTDSSPSADGSQAPTDGGSDAPTGSTSGDAAPEQPTDSTASTSPAEQDGGAQ